jgi:hypothetical protein
MANPILADYTVEVINMAESLAIKKLEQSAEVVKSAAAQLCAIKTGAMVESLIIQPDGLIVHIGYTKPYAYWVETGTKPHTIRVKNKKVMYNAEQDKFYGTIVEHPGAAAHPSLVPALEQSKSKIMGIFHATA